MRRWFLTLLLLGSVSSSGFCAETALRVRLWSQHAVRELKLWASPEIQVRTCPACKPLPGGEFSVTAQKNMLRLSGATTTKLLVRGSYVASVQGRAVPLSTPLELKSRDGLIEITANMSLEEYVAGVLAGEAGGMKSPEALKAMAVAIRTYALHFRPRHGARGYDFCDTTHCQDLRLSSIGDRVRAAVSATEGELLWYQGSTIASYYHQDCGGTTERAAEDLSLRGQALPYLRQQQDSYCVRRGTAQWQSTASKEELSRALNGAGLHVPPNVRTLNVSSRSSSGRVLTLRVAGEFVATLPQDQFQRALGRALGWNRLRSAMYDVSDHGDSVTFIGRGSGHGVGLCQVGAAVMADEGHDYRDILAHYYPGTTVGLTGAGLQWTTLGSGRFDLMTVRPESDRSFVSRAETVLREAEERSGISLSAHPTLRVYPTVAAYRDATGEPGWVGASTRGSVIRLQPIDVLQRTRSADIILRHEFLHLLVESKARRETPLWFREGLVLWLNADSNQSQKTVLKVSEIERKLRTPANQEDLRTAYKAAQAQVAHMAQKYGKAAVISMLSNGLPAELR